MESQQSAKEAGILEREIKIYENKYHGCDITILEIEHAFKEGLGATSLRPKDWKEEIVKQLDQRPDSLIFSEYCMPEIDKNIIRVPGVNIFKKALEDAGITDFYSHLSLYAGSKGKSLYAVDMANKPAFELYFHLLLRDNNERSARMQNPDFVDEKEKDIFSVLDARHLVSARGMMQEILRQNKPIVNINAPTHAINIDAEIRRQIAWELESSIKPNIPVEFRYASPERENKKMMGYSRLFPLDISVREYKPTLPGIAYTIEADAKNPNVSNLDLLSKINNFLSVKVNSPNHNQVRKRILNLKRILEKDKITESTRPQKPETNMIMTDRFGWRLTRKDFIY